MREATPLSEVIGVTLVAKIVVLDYRQAYENSRADSYKVGGTPKRA